MPASLSPGLGAITLFVEDVQRAKSFYENAFALTAVFEDAESACFKFDNTLINLLLETAAHELIAPAQVATATGSRAQFTIWVDDADGACALLATRGISLLNGPQDRAWGQRTAAFADPDGHVWEIAQDISG